MKVTNVRLRPEEKTVLQRIRERVERTDWTKGAYRTAEGGKMRYCLVGLVRDEVPASIEPDKAMQARFYHRRSRLEHALYAAIKRLQPSTRSASIEAWNDRKLTKRSDVIAVIDEAIKGP